MEVTNQLDKLPLEICLKIGAILESDSKFHLREKFKVNSKKLKFFLDTHFMLNNLGEFTDYFIDWKEDKLNDYPYSPNNKFYDIMSKTYKNKPIRIKRDSCRCINEDKFRDIIFEFTEGWCMYEIFYCLNRMDYYNECYQGCHFYGFDITEYLDEYIVNLKYYY